MTRILVFDVGRTGCRGALIEHSRTTATAAVASAGGFAERRGVVVVLQTIDRVAGELAAGAVDAVGVGLAGFEHAEDRAEALARGLRARFGTSAVALTSDMTTWHAGALDGAPGVVLTAGTGAVALAIGPSGASAVVDGCGYLLGDDGSGHAIGRAGLASALRAGDGRAGSEALRARAEERFGDLADLPRLVHNATDPAQMIASFAPEVLAAARAGDAVATGIWHAAGRDLARTAAAAAHRVFGDDAAFDVVATGGLFQAGTDLRTPFERELRRLAPAVRPVAARGDALAGARLLLTDRDLPHAARVRYPLDASKGARATPATDGADALGRLITERARPELATLDAWSTAELVALLAAEDAQVPAAVARVEAAITAAVDAIVGRLAKGGRLVYVGAGSSGRLAVLDAAECPPTFGVDDGRVAAVLAGGDAAMTSAVEGAEDNRDAAARDLEAMGLTADDAVVGIAASGRTPYVIAAMDVARRHGAVTIGVSNNPGSNLSAQVDHAIEVVTGPEVIAGSTRMKAGTAQKLVLNTLSTVSMIRLGKTYGNLMVDVAATNAKLRERACRIVVEAAGVDRSEARRALRAADGHAKTAIVALLADVDVPHARRRLERAQGNVRAAVGRQQP